MDFSKMKLVKLNANNVAVLHCIKATLCTDLLHVQQ
tara:strand:- start:127 stop:234 length:108 start_codon:yes stop_codon:yes gene_type:complete